MAIPRVSVQRTSLADEAYRQLTLAIINRDLRPGDRLVMDELADSLGISRTPIREALQKLELERVIDPQPRRGYIVRELSDKEVELQYEARLAIEPFALGEVARRGGDVVKRLRVTYERLCQETPETLFDIFRITREFHLTMVSVLDNEFLDRMMEVIWNTGMSFRVFAEIDQQDEVADFAGEHRELIEAAESGDPTTASEAAAQHILAGRRLHSDA